MVDAGKARVAVVVVHGMGQHLPMETVERVVRAAIPPRSDRHGGGDEMPPIPTYFSRPDRVAGQLELRRFLAPRDPHRTTADHPSDVGKNRLHTEIYEYHWAHMMKGNRVHHVWPLVARLLFPHRSSIGRLHVAAWAALTVCLAVSYGAFLVVAGQTDSTWLPWLAALAAMPVVSFGLGKLADMLAASFGDVARYLYPTPGNLAVRRDVHQGLVEMLLRLHHSGRYDRICLVAHSLGSCIAYDAISRCWAQLGRLHGGNPNDRAQPSLDTFEATAKSIRGDGDPDVGVSEFQQAQWDLWREYRSFGNPWLITDLVTLGSPMTYANWLITRSRTQLRSKQTLRELATCPPTPERPPAEEPDGKKFNVDYWCTWDHQGVRVPHHAAPFAMTRWTNIYYPGFFGDWFGGELSTNFGPGIRNVAVTEDGRLTKLPLAAHSMYFRYHDHPSPTTGKARTYKETGAVSELRKALRLDRSDLPGGSIPPIDSATDDEPRLGIDGQTVWP